MKKRLGNKWIIIAAVVVVIAAGIIIVPRVLANSRNSSTTYQTAPLGRGNITETVGATGNVYTNQTVQLSWQTSGVVKNVNVTKGQLVAANTVLAQLDPTSLPQSILSAQTDLTAAKKALDDLLNSGTARANAELALIQAEQNLTTAQKAAQSKLFQRASQSTIDIAQANLIEAQNALNTAADIYNRNKNRNQNDSTYAAALSQFANAQQKFDTAQYNMQYVTALPDPLSVQAANAQVDVAQAAYLDAKRTWETVKDGPNPIDVAAAQAKVDSAQSIINEAEITTPIAGTVTQITSKVGDLVAPATVGFQIDDLSHLYINIQVSEVDINKVQKGQPVGITFDALPDKNFEGTVTDIDTVGTTSSGAVNFNVTTEITSKDPHIKPGMTATANITVTNLANVLVIPNRAIKTINTRQIVYVMQNGSLRPVPITTGISSTDTTQLLTGNLQEGESIVLDPPTATTLTTGARAGGLFGGLFGGIRIGGGGGGNFGGNGGGNFGGGAAGGTRPGAAGTTGGTGGSSSSGAGAARPAGGG